MRTIQVLVMLVVVGEQKCCWILYDKTLYKHNVSVTNIQNRNNHFVGSMSNSLFSLCLHSYVLCSSGKLELVGWGSGERNKQQGGSGYEAGTYFVALDVSEKYQSQMQWPLEHLEISVAFRRSKHGELCSVACIYCVCVCVYTHTLLLWIFSVLVYVLVCLYSICVCVECKIHCLPHSIKVVGNIIETCDREAGQKLLLKGHMDIFWTIWRIWRKCRERNAKSPE